MDKKNGKGELTIDAKAGVVAGVLVVPFTLGLFGLLLWIDGLLFSTMWNWWVAATFGIKSLSVVEAVGVSLIIHYYRDTMPWHYENGVWRHMFKALGTDLVIFIMAWLLLLFR